MRLHTHSAAVATSVSNDDVDDDDDEEEEDAPSLSLSLSSLASVAVHVTLITGADLEREKNKNTHPLLLLFLLPRLLPRRLSSRSLATLFLFLDSRPSLAMCLPHSLAHRIRCQRRVFRSTSFPSSSSLFPFQTATQCLQVSTPCGLRTPNCPTTSSMTHWKAGQRPG